jgi:hypothetical protein
MKKYKNIFYFLLFGVFVFLSQSFVSADAIIIANPLEHNTIEAIIIAVVTFVRNVAFAIAPIIFIWGGFKFYFAGGDPGKAKEAANLIKWAIVGLAIIIVANGIIYVVQDVIGVEEEESSIFIKEKVVYNLE